MPVRLFIKTVCLSCLFCFLSSAVYSQSENKLRAQLKNDPVFITYNNARLTFITGIIEDKWGYRNADKEMIKNGKKNIKSFNDIKELYRKAGVDSGYLMDYNNMYYAKAIVAKKYKAIIRSNPEMFKKVTKELTSSVPKPPKLNLNSAH